MVLAVGLLIPGFTGCPPGSTICIAMYWITQSGGWMGTLIIVLLVSLSYSFIPLHPRGRLVMFVRTFLALAIVLGVSAKVNETFIKSRLAISRPSHQYILNASRSKADLDSVYLLLTDERRLFFRSIVDHDTIHFKEIDERVLRHWIDEAGYSMPSGHTFNAFLLASMLAFSLFELNQRHITWWLYLPMVWAALVGMSRVVLGVHTALDVSLGGVLGLAVSHLLLAIPLTNRLLVPSIPRRSS